PVCRRQSRWKTGGRRRPKSCGPSSTTIEEGVRSVDYHDERFEGRGPVVDVFRMRGGVAHAHVRTRCRTQRGRELDVVFFGGFRIVEGNAVDVAAARETARPRSEARYFGTAVVQVVHLRLVLLYHIYAERRFLLVGRI